MKKDVTDPQQPESHATLVSEIMLSLQSLSTLPGSFGLEGYKINIYYIYIYLKVSRGVYERD